MHPRVAQETFPRVPLRSPAPSAPDQGGGPTRRSHGLGAPARRRAPRRGGGCDARRVSVSVRGLGVPGWTMKKTRVLPWKKWGFEMIELEIMEIFHQTWGFHLVIHCFKKLKMKIYSQDHIMNTAHTDFPQGLVCRTNTRAWSSLGPGGVVTIYRKWLWKGFTTSKALFWMQLIHQHARSLHS